MSNRFSKFAFAMLAGASLFTGAAAQESLTATTVRRLAAPDAGQGAAFGAHHVFAVDNSVIAKHDLETGALVARFEDKDRLLAHMNSCLVVEAKLMCANSNYPQSPMASSIEIFDPESLTHSQTHSLGLMDEGSLVWFDRREGGWLVGFAHYDGARGAGFKDHAFSSVVAFDAQWRRTGGWAFPAETLARMAPHAASGGAVGPDGLLYVMGHDRPEIYALAKPPRGPALTLVATIAVDAHGQAFSFAPDGSRRIAAVDRKSGEILIIDLPPVATHALAPGQFFRRPPAER
ncbi:MAG: hypothetical protein R3C42_01450 [Parvularculaceae bacterium]|nr:hypothetical protein [Parvularculaceae bacterium]